MSPDFATSVQEELMNVVEGFGLDTLSSDTDTRDQLKQAIDIGDLSWVLTVGSLAALLTTDKSSIVNAINEVFGLASGATPVYQSYTPAFTQGIGTVSAVAMYYIIIGNQMQIGGHLTGGTISAAEMQIAIPAGYVVADVAGNTDTILCGRWDRYDTYTTPYNVIVTPGDNFLNFSQLGLNALIPQNGSALSGSGQRLSLYATFPVEPT
jgi:hypothetical protein